VRIFFYLPISYAHNFFCKCRVMYITYSIRASYTHNLYIKNLLKKYKNEKKEACAGQAARSLGATARRTGFAGWS
jgi:hypothetical protein